MIEDNCHPHLIRTSIEIHSIRFNKFKGSIFAKIISLDELNIRSFQTAPNLNINFVNSPEILFERVFQSFDKFLDQHELSNTLKEKALVIELYYNEKYKVDYHFGNVIIPLEKILDIEYDKSEHSYIRIYDSYHIIEDETNPNQAIGEIRVKLFLEDYGPSNNLLSDETTDELLHVQNIDVSNNKEAFVAQNNQKRLQESEIRNDIGRLIRRDRDESDLGIGELEEGGRVQIQTISQGTRDRLHNQTI